MKEWSSEIYELVKSNNVVGIIKWIVILFYFFAPALPIIYIFYYDLFLELEFTKLLILIVFIDSIIILYFSLISFLVNLYDIVSFSESRSIISDFNVNRMIDEAKKESGEDEFNNKTFMLYADKMAEYRSKSIKEYINGQIVFSLTFFLSVYFVIILIMFGFTYFLSVPFRIEDIIRGSLLLSSGAIWSDIRKWKKNSTSVQKDNKIIPILLKVYFFIQLVLIILLTLKIRL